MTESPLPEELIFAQAQEIGSTSDRAAYLDRACNENSALRAEVEALLRADALSGDLLDLPEQRPTTVDAAQIGESCGSLIGCYKLLEPIGEGGFGVVFRAEQTHPIRRMVALKVIKPGMDTRQVVARFEAERQALAILDHSNIAKVFDGGTTPSGRPYFVMELVRGMPITDYCDQNHLTPRQRLELFIPVCEAVQHAHQKGIIHRDLKPSNVLINVFDSKPVVKVIDFGVAKAMAQDLTDKTLFTGITQMIGTPLYMSPEQAGQSGLDVDTRSDIYSLGVVLYELLTGSTPFEKERFKTAAYDEIRRIIREEDPPKPSTRLSDSKDSLPSISAQRRIEPAKLSKLIRGELDWIVMKALEKDRNRRYETANGFAADVRRYLADETVLACPPSAGYRLRKFVRRNQTSVIAASLVFASMLIGLLGTAVALTIAQSERSAAEESRSKAIAETYRALMSETRALRIAHQPGWRQDAWRNFHRLLELGSPLHDAVSMRGEVLACLGEIDAIEVTRLNEGQRHGTWSLDFSRDGGLLASQGWDGVTRVWDLSKGRAIKTVADQGYIQPQFSQATSPFPSAVFDPRHRSVVRTTWSKKVEWLSTDGNDTLPTSLTGTTQPRGIVFNRDGRFMAVAWADGKVDVRDLSTGRIVRTINAGNFPLGAAIALHPNGESLAVASSENRVLLWPVNDDEPPILVGYHGNARSLRFSKDGRFLATASPPDRTAKVWDIRKRREFLTLSGHSARVQAVDFSADDSMIATGSDDQSIRIWDAQTGQPLLSLHPGIGPILSVAFSPDSDRIAAAADEIVIYELKGRTTRRQLYGHTYSIFGIVSNPKSQQIVSGSWDHYAICWNLKGGFPRTAWQRDLKRPVSLLASSPDGKWIAAAYAATNPPLPNADYSIEILDALTGQTSKRLSGLRTTPNSQCFDRRCRWFAACGSDGQTCVWDVSAGLLLHHWESANERVGTVAFIGGGQLLCSDETGEIIIRDLPSGRMVQRAVLGLQVNRVAVAPDERTIAVADKSGIIHLYSMPGFEEIARTKQRHGNAPLNLHFVENGKLLLSGGYDRRAFLWDVANMEEVLEFPPQNSPIYNIAYHPETQLIALVGAEERITLWDLGRIRMELQRLGLGWDQRGAQSRRTSDLP